MDFNDYKAFWNDKAATPEGARIAVDGSHDEAILRLTGAFTATQVRAALDLCPSDHVFELGCGVGRIGREIAGEVASWQGLDIAENMLAVAAQRLAGVGRCGFHALSGPALPMLADGSMDKGYSVAVLFHMDKEDLVLYLREVARVLRPGGLFYFDHWNLLHPVGWRRFMLEVEQAARQPAGRRKDVARNQFSTAQELQLYARAMGLAPVLVLQGSPCVQLVLCKPGGAPGAEEAEEARLAAVAGRIDYGRQWTAYFEAIVIDEATGSPWREVVARLAPAAADDPVANMFRAWVAGVWRHRPAWGPVPPGLHVPPESPSPVSA